MDKNLVEHNQHSFSSKKLSMPGQYHQDFRNEETSHPFFPSTIMKQNKITAPLSQTMNIKNPLTPFHYLSLFRPMSFDTQQSPAYNHLHPMNTTTSNQQNSSNNSTTPSTNYLEEPTVLKLNIPIEMIVRSIPQQLSSSTSSSQHCNHRYNQQVHDCFITQMPCHTPSNYSSKPPTSLIRKAQEVFFGHNINNDRGDVPLKTARRTDMSTCDSRITNDTNKSLEIQQQGKFSHKSMQGSSHQSMIPRYSDSSSPSCHRRCECESTIYSPM